MAINSNPYDGKKFCDVCGEVFEIDTPLEALRNHQCEIPEDPDNKGNPELKNKQQDGIDIMLKDIKVSEDALNSLVDSYADAKAKIAEYLAEHFDQAQKETKKSAGMDVFMLWAASKAGLTAEYKTYVQLSKKATIHTAILESKGRRLSGLQTKTKLNDWRK